MLVQDSVDGAIQGDIRLGGERDMTEYELELLEGISHSLKEIVVEMKEANRLLGGVCSVSDKSLAQPAIDPGKYVPRKERNTSTLVDSFTYDHGWK